MSCWGVNGLRWFKHALAGIHRTILYLLLIANAGGKLQKINSNDVGGNDKCLQPRHYTPEINLKSQN